MQISGQKKKKKKPAAPDAPRAKGMSALGQAPGAAGPGGGLPGSAPGAAPPLQFKSIAGEVEKLMDGCVVLRGAVPLADQQRFLNACFERGSQAQAEGGNGGFFEPPKEEGGRLVLNQGNRGRIIHPVGDFPDYFRESCLRWVADARSRDTSLPAMDPTTLLVNFYNVRGTFKWHRDTEDPALVRKGVGKPIVSVTIGEACDFGYKMDYDAAEHQTVRLESGDVLLFGGPARMMVHSVLRILPGTRPSGLKFPYQIGRLNLTFRDVEGVIDTSMFPAYRVKYDIEEEGAG